MIQRSFTAHFSEADKLAAFITLALSHGGKLIPERTSEKNGEGMYREWRFAQVTVEIPEKDNAAESFNICVRRTKLIENDEFEQRW